MTSIEDKAHQLGATLLGDYGRPYSPVCQWETDQGLMRFQQYWNCAIQEYPTSRTPDGRDCLVILEGTLPQSTVDLFRAASGRTGADTATVPS